MSALSEDAVGLGLRALELDARLGLGGLRFRLDLDAVAEPAQLPGALWPQGPAARPQLAAEWAAVDVAAAGGWVLAGGLRPLDSAGEALDGWNRPLAPHSTSFLALWPGSLLGAWAERGGEVQVSGWAGVRTGGAPGRSPIPPGADQAVLGAGLGLGEGALSGDLALSVLPLQSWAALTGSLSADLGDPLLLTGGAWLTGWPDSLQLALLATALGAPGRSLSPVARLEWAPGTGAADWVLDGGLRWRPQRSVQLSVSARLAGDSFGATAGLAFFEDPEAR